MALGRQMDDAIHVLLLHQLEHPLEVADIHLHKAVVGPVLNVLEVGQVPRIGELVQVNDLILRVLVHKQAHHMAADKPGTAGDNQSSLIVHVALNFKWAIKSLQPRMPPVLGR